VSRHDELRANLVAVEARVTAACTAAGRDRSEVTVVAVTKTWPVSDIAILRILGVRDVGENRDGEAAQKAAALPDLRWHFVGTVQTNKARSVASYADVVHSVDRASLVEALSAGAQRAERQLDVLVQVSLDGAPGRGGALPGDVPRLADLAADAAGLRLAGVMAVAPLGGDAAAAFDRLRQVADKVLAGHPTAEVISAGMSGDLEPAVAAGANLLRVGTALLGHRAPIPR
jgi:pyridoxal phosphate enzyme (YggS family)